MQEATGITGNKIAPRERVMSALLLASLGAAAAEQLNTPGVPLEFAKATTSFPRSRSLEETDVFSSLSCKEENLADRWD